MRRAILTLALLLGGCLESSAVPCGGGRVCPAGRVCEDRLPEPACVLPEQQTVCSDGGLAPNDTCEIAGGFTGVCRDVGGGAACIDCLCIEPFCGDGFVDRALGEACDGAALPDGPACTDNGFYEGEEVVCTATCQLDVEACARSCGDGVVDLDQAEVCDGAPPLESCVGLGFDAGRAACIEGGCSPDPTTCRSIGWDPVLVENVHMMDAQAVDGGVLVLAADDPLDRSEAVLFHFDGTRWSRSPNGEPMQKLLMWAASPDEVYVLGVSNDGLGRRLLAYDGDAWDGGDAGEASAIWGSGPGDVWLFDGGTLRRGDGDSWNDSPVPDLVEAATVWGSSEDDVWVSGTMNSAPNPGLLHWNGNTWQRADGTIGVVTGVFGTGPDDVYAAAADGLQRWDGDGWQLVWALGQVQDLWGRGPDDLYVKGNDPFESGIFHFDGDRWSALAPTFDDTFVVGTADDVMAASAQTVTRYGGSAWDEVDLSPALDDDGMRIDSIWAATPDLVFATRSDLELVTFDHGVVSRTFDLLVAAAVAGVGDDVVAVGYDGYAARWNGGADWVAEAGPGPFHMYAAAGAGGDLLFAVGQDIAVRDGGVWDACDVPDVVLFSIWCDEGGADCVAAGAGGTVARWSGGAPCDWEVDTLDVDGAVLFTVWGASPDDVWVGGQNVTFLHWDGEAWERRTVPGLNSPINSLAGSSSEDVLVAGNNGALYRLEGDAFAPVRFPFEIWRPRLHATAGTVWVVGSADGTTDTDRAGRLERTVPW